MYFIEAGLRALRLRIEFADGLNFVAEEFDTHGTVVLRRVDVEDSATAGKLAGHFDEVHLGVTDRCEMGGEDFDVDLLTATKGDGQAGIVIAIKEPERSRLDGRDQNVDGSGCEFPQSLGALLLYIRMG